MLNRPRDISVSEMDEGELSMKPDSSANPPAMCSKLVSRSEREQMIRSVENTIAFLESSTI